MLLPRLVREGQPMKCLDLLYKLKVDKRRRKIKKPATFSSLTTLIYKA